jgi:uncharacterized membrane protein
MLSPLPQEEIARILDYYVEAIDDRMEDGMTEDEAIASLGDLQTLAEKIRQEQPDPIVPPAPAPRRRLPGWAILLLIVGSPVWLGLGLGILGAGLGVYASLWAVLLSGLIALVCCLGGGVVCAVGAFFLPVTPDSLGVRVLTAGAGLALVGIVLLLIPGYWWLLRAFLRLHRWCFYKCTRKETL